MNVSTNMQIADETKYENADEAENEDEDEQAICNVKDEAADASEDADKHAT